MAPPSLQRKKLKVSNNLKEQLTAKLEKIIVKAVAALVALEKLIAKKEQLTHRPCLGCFGSRKKAKKASTGIRRARGGYHAIPPSSFSYSAIYCCI
jgi:hypothetical protein